MLCKLDGHSVLLQELAIMHQFGDIAWPKQLSTLGGVIVEESMPKGVHMEKDMQLAR